MDSLYDDADLYGLVAPPDAAMERFYVEAAGGPFGDFDRSQMTPDSRRQVCIAAIA